MIPLTAFGLYFSAFSHVSFFCIVIGIAVLIESGMVYFLRELYGSLGEL